MQPQQDEMKIIFWKASALILSWALLGFALYVIRTKITEISYAEFATLLLASASYLIGTTAMLNPITKKKDENKMP
jgi:hypothetical protein